MGKGKEIDNYGAGPPWLFTGRALYQLHLVKADVARRIIPPELNIVEAFGYTLGGLYFAQYDSSPAGKFDELVALAGIVWNPPTSCAWAARVLVDSVTARDHGIQKVGLPSQLASFSKSMVCLKADQPKFSFNLGFLRTNRRESGTTNQESPQGQDCPLVPGRTSVQVARHDGPTIDPLCHLTLPPDRPAGQPVFPRIKMVLPSFSGRTRLQPDLLWYGCGLQCGVRIVKPAKIELLPSSSSSPHLIDSESRLKLQKKSPANIASDDLRTLLSSRPIFAMVFDEMKMSVAAPSPVAIRPSAPRQTRGDPVGSPAPVPGGPGDASQVPVPAT